MIKLSLLLGLVACHFIGDFLLQTEWEATNKWHSWTALLSHTACYSLGFFYFGPVFQLITFACHTLTDYITSRWNHYAAEEAKATGRWHEFFAGVGFDQSLHYAQLFVTAYYLLR